MESDPVLTIADDRAVSATDWEQEFAFLQPLSVSMSSSEGDGRQLQLRLDVPAETSSYAARPLLLSNPPLLLWAFQSSQWQLQAVLCVSKAHAQAS